MPIWCTSEAFFRRRIDAIRQSTGDIEQLIPDPEPNRMEISSPGSEEVEQGQPLYPGVGLLCGLQSGELQVEPAYRFREVQIPYV